ncbi:YggS family pyridoxal phosphate-dependent enzyme [Acidithiobacillus sp. AMEEHan]|uniref:YggS family pyridoxal phosphate-dependent enzyme n=1 Tax=Acidithiobacillus sp. AMEEHan TaxID=2994951 RepID=UPI0027E4747A|nr:YggS family pyridoxal phosphate-dependent enzyme [Acidithiobacillus sp. AMEEHan]
MDLAPRLQQLQQEIQGDVPCRLLAVSKTVPAERIRAAYALGLHHFGENYLQEALAKMAALADLKISWHFIGRIQRNKTREIARHFDWVESIDRSILVERLDRERAGLPPLQVLIEVAISGEKDKGGCTKEDIFPLAEQIVACDNLRLRGLMALVHPTPGEARKNFAQMREFYEQLRGRFTDQQIDTLSMGTSGDYPEALAHGATEIRLGTALFGGRPKE